MLSFIVKGGRLAVAVIILPYNRLAPNIEHPPQILRGIRGR